jgi:glucose-6-phosphate dehydrogenase assembly protein OpcA
LFDSQPLSTAALKPDKLILDSAAAADPLAMLQRLAEETAVPPIADLAWTRLTHLREIVAQVFENAAFHALLARVREACVFHDGDSITPEARYFAGWVMDALGREIQVRFESASERAVEFRGPDMQPVHIAACPRARESALLGEELGILGPDPVYDRALRLAAGLRGC